MAITWTEPTFTDNVKVTRISNNEVRAEYLLDLSHLKHYQQFHGLFYYYV